MRKNVVTIGSLMIIIGILLLMLSWKFIFWTFGLAFLLLFFGVFVLIAGFVRRPPLHVMVEHKTEDPLALLKLRFAKGEINKKEYEKMKKALK